MFLQPLHWQWLLADSASIAVLNSIVQPDEKGLDKEVVYEADLFSRGNRYNSNDYFRGKYKNIPFPITAIAVAERPQQLVAKHREVNGQDETYYE